MTESHFTLRPRHGAFNSLSQYTIALKIANCVTRVDMGRFQSATGFSPSPSLPSHYTIAFKIANCVTRADVGADFSLRRASARLPRCRFTTRSLSKSRIASHPTETPAGGYTQMSFRQTMIPSGWITGTLLFVASALLSAGVPSREEQLAQDRNLGKAFYENPTTQIEAVAEFRKALELAPDSTREKLNYGLALLRAGKVQDGVAMLKEVQRRDPTLPHTWFNLGIYYKKAGDFVNATAQFEQMAKLTPDEPIVHYQLGVLYKLAGRTEQARTQFELTAKLNPGLAAAHFQLYNLDRQARQEEEAKRQLTAFQQLKKQHESAAIPEDVDWCVYAEIYDPPAAPASLPIGKPSFK